MNIAICKLRGCSRLSTYTVTRGKQSTNVAECNQYMPDDLNVWWQDCKAVTKERCKELRDESKRQREVQV